MSHTPTTTTHLRMNAEIASIVHSTPKLGTNMMCLTGDGHASYVTHIDGPINCAECLKLIDKHGLRRKLAADSGVTP